MDSHRKGTYLSACRPGKARYGISLGRRDGKLLAVRPGGSAGGPGQKVVPSFRRSSRPEGPDMGSPRAGLYHGTWWGWHKSDSYRELAAGRFTELFPFLPGAEFDQADL